MLRKIIVSFALLLIAGFSSAQQPDKKSKAKALADAAWARAACGSDAVHFDVNMDKNQHPLTDPESGKALVYVFEDDLTQGGFPTTRVGLDSKWVGANISNSYLFFSVTPGSHRLCSNWQGHPVFGAAVDFTAEAGKVYFFDTKIIASGNDYFMLNQVPEAEGHFLIASHGLSTSVEKSRNED